MGKENRAKMKKNIFIYKYIYKKKKKTAEFIVVPVRIGYYVFGQTDRLVHDSLVFPKKHVVVMFG